VAASAVFGVVVAELVTLVVAGLISHMSWTAGDNSLVISDSFNGLALAVAGWPIAAYRPRNPIGWLLLAGGVTYTASATAYALLENATRADAGNPFWRVAAMLADSMWAPAITFCLPVALLLFPGGRLPGRRWRWVIVVALAGTAADVILGMIDIPGFARDRGVRGYLPSVAPQALGAVSVAIGFGVWIAWGAALLALGLRFRRAPQPLRRQLSWPLLGLIFVMLTFIPVWGDSTIGLMLIAALPASITIAIFRRQLFDIQIVVSRSLVYLALTGGIVGAYLILVAFFDRVLDTRHTLGSSVLATIVIAVGFNPVRVFLQRAVDRAIYGARNDPVRAIAEVGARLSEAGTPTRTGLDAALEALCGVMHYPSAAIMVRGVRVASFGMPLPGSHATPLGHDDERLGELVVGLRSGESRLTPGDLQVLALLAAPIGVAVKANALAERTTRIA
jgi:two-component system, NarL family, sensor kinase